MENKKLMLVVSNEDTVECLNYLSNIGKKVYFGGSMRLIKDVRTIEGFCLVDFE